MLEEEWTKKKNREQGDSDEKRCHKTVGGATNHSSRASDSGRGGASGRRERDKWWDVWEKVDSVK